MTETFRVSNVDFDASEDELAGARRLNRLLACLPRFHTGRRWNARLVQSFLALHRVSPDLRRIRSKVLAMSVPGTSCSVRITRPPGKALGLLLHFHGGAWVMGSARLEDRLASWIANDCRLVVAAVDFTNALDDNLAGTVAECMVTAHWIADNLDLFEVNRMLLSGESSGAHLGMETLLDLRSHGKHHYVRGFYSVCGAFDLVGSASLRESSDRALLMSGPSALQNLYRLTPSLPLDKRRGPLHADLYDLPPALFIAGEADPIVADSIEMHARWKAMNHDASLIVVPEAPHGFNRFPTRLAAKANAFGRQWLRDRVE